MWKKTMGETTPIALENPLAETQKPVKSVKPKDISSKKNNLSEYTLAELHTLILQTKHLYHMEQLLGLRYPTLATHLGKLTTRNYDYLKGLSPETAALEFPLYHVKFKNGVPSGKLKTFTMAKIHENSLVNKSLSSTAASLGVRPRTLQKYLRGLNALDGTPLTFEKLQNLPRGYYAQPHLAPAPQLPFTEFSNLLEVNEASPGPSGPALCFQGAPEVSSNAVVLPPVPERTEIEDIQEQSGQSTSQDRAQNYFLKFFDQPPTLSSQPNSNLDQQDLAEDGFLSEFGLDESDLAVNL